MSRYIIIALCFLAARVVFAADAPDLEDQTRAIATELRCVVCQNLSVADSPSDMAQQMRAIVREQVQTGKTPQEIKDFFVSKYGEWVLLKPATRGFSLLVWVVPFVALIIGLALGGFFIWRWAARSRSAAPAHVDPKLLERVRTEATGELRAPDLEDASPDTQLRQDRFRLYADLKELEFDFQAGKLSEADYTGLRRDIETKAAAVLVNLDKMRAAAARETGSGKRAAQAAKATEVAQPQPGLRGWQVAVGGALLLVFGLTLGVVLTNSLKPRGSEGESITGDFLTGTRGTSGGDVAGLLQAAKAAFDKQDFRNAIEGFKKVLAADPNQPEANSYMGLILMQAGHADGALMAFDKALSRAPNFPVALWGKGMALYQGKQDYAGAREVFEKLLPLVPPGQERDAIVKVLAEIAAAGQKPQMTAKPAPAAASFSSGTAGQITGQITIDSKLKVNVDPQAALFIIARPAAGGGGPPLAVKKIDHPAFPLSYSLGAENVMMQGTPFTGKITITVRLDQDGNPATRGAGDLTGDYKKNPVEVGSKNVDIVLDQVAK